MTKKHTCRCGTTFETKTEKNVCTCGATVMFMGYKLDEGTTVFAEGIECIK